MGTNVYALRKNIYTKDLYNKYKEAIENEDDNKLDELNESFQQLREENTIHIGKRSGGWKFLFNHNNWKYYDYTKQSIDSFLRSCYKLKNEYGEEITIDEFWKEYVDDFGDGVNGEQYCKLELERANAKERGELEDKFNLIMSVPVAQNYFYEGKKNNWYEEQYCSYNNKTIKIPYETLNYRFSNSVNFG